MTIKWSHSFRKNFRCEKYKVEAPKTGSKSKYLYNSSTILQLVLGNKVKINELDSVLSFLVKGTNSSGSNK